jgi:hypothetical protein
MNPIERPWCLCCAYTSLTETKYGIYVGLLNRNEIFRLYFICGLFNDAVIV